MNSDSPVRRPPVTLADYVEQVRELERLTQEQLAQRMEARLRTPPPPPTEELGVEL